MVRFHESYSVASALVFVSSTMQNSNSMLMTEKTEDWRTTKQDVFVGVQRRPRPHTKKRVQKTFQVVPIYLNLSLRTKRFLARFSWFRLCSFFRLALITVSSSSFSLAQLFVYAIESAICWTESLKYLHSIMGSKKNWCHHNLMKFRDFRRLLNWASTSAQSIPSQLREKLCNE